MAAASCSAVSLSSLSSSAHVPHHFRHLSPPLTTIPLSCLVTRVTARSLLGTRASPFLGRCAASSGPPPEAPFPDDSDRREGIFEAFSRSRDVPRVFFGVLFWMSLFFWACAWDKRNSIGPNKRS